MSRQSEFWRGKEPGSVETSLSRYLRKVQEGNKYHIQKSTSSPPSPQTKKTRVPTPLTPLRNLPQTPPQTPNSKQAKSNKPLKESSDEASPLSEELQNSQPVATDHQEIKCLIKEMSQELKLHIQQSADKIDHLNENIIELIQCNRELVMEMKKGAKVFPVPPKTRRSSRDARSTRDALSTSDAFSTRNSHTTGANRNANKNSHVIKSIITTTCFMTPFMVFLIDYYQSAS